MTSAKNGKSRLGFIMCSELGRLEFMTALCAASLRVFGGQFKNAPIYAYCPRKGREIRNRSRKLLEKFDVDYREIELNRDFRDYPLANKPLVAAHAEANSDCDVLVFVDSDQLILSEPSELALPDGIDVAMRPEDLKGIGTNGKDDRELDYWKAMLDLVGTQKWDYVTTAIGEERIVAYWNTGLVATRTQLGLFARWRHDFCSIMEAGLLPHVPKGHKPVFFVEQSSWAATVMGAKAKVKILSNSYNYPLSLHHRMPKKISIDSFDKMTTAHYHQMLNKPNLFKIHPFAPFWEGNEKKEILKELVNTCGVYPGSLKNWANWTAWNLRARVAPPLKKLLRRKR